MDKKKGTNIFDQEQIDWKSWTASLLWHNIVYHKNEYSGYDMVVKTNEKKGGFWGKNPYPRGHNIGDIVSDTRFLSYSIGSIRKLTWKELALSLGFWKEQLLTDGHDCDKCPKNSSCNAFFKYDINQERCNVWKDEKTIDERYEEFMDELVSDRLPEMTLLKKL